MKKYLNSLCFVVLLCSSAYSQNGSSIEGSGLPEYTVLIKSNASELEINDFDTLYTYDLIIHFENEAQKNAFEGDLTIESSGVSKSVLLSKVQYPDSVLNNNNLTRDMLPFYEEQSVYFNGLDLIYRIGAYNEAYYDFKVYHKENILNKNDKINEKYR